MSDDDDKDDKLEKLLVQRKALDERIRKEQNRKNAIKRKADTRRKVLAGAAVLDESEHNAKYKTALYGLLERFLTREDDRALFGFEPLPASPEQAKQKAAAQSSNQTTLDDKTETDSGKN